MIYQYPIVCVYVREREREKERERERERKREKEKERERKRGRKREVFRLLNIAKNFIFQYFLSQRIPEPVLCPRYGRVGAGFDLSGSL